MITGDVISVNTEMIIGDLEFNIEDLESPLTFGDQNLVIGEWHMGADDVRKGHWLPEIIPNDQKPIIDCLVFHIGDWTALRRSSLITATGFVVLDNPVYSTAVAAAWLPLLLICRIISFQALLKTTCILKNISLIQWYHKLEAPINIKQLTSYHT